MYLATLPELLAHAAVERADKEAFVFLDQRLSYSELHDRARRLAAALRDSGVRTHDRVGVFMHKSLESVVAIYGIMLAGAAYVPLDPAMPIERFRNILEDCGIRLLVTHPLKRKSVETLCAASHPLVGVLGLEDPPDEALKAVSWAELEVYDDTGFLPPAIIEHDPAYIMYTSGSTGLPKGIVHTHGSGLSYARQAAMIYGLGPEDRLANFAPLHFDQSTFEMFAGPLAGATTVIFPEAYMKLPASLSQLAADEKITVWYSVPHPLIQMRLRGVLEERDLSSLRWVLYGGEPFPPDHLYALMAAWPQVRFSNVYGPAEVNQCTYFHLPPIPEDREAPIPIGRIWENAEGLIVDTDDQPVGTGDVGELLVHSPTMMAGYWGRPDLNEKAFYRQEIFPGYERVYYRTGDLVKDQGDGVLDFLGRKDRQVKARGFRIELDEIEAALGSHVRVEEAAAFTIPDGEGSRRVEAAVIPGEGAQDLAPELSRFLRDKLPVYAIPEIVHLRSTFPRTTSGKIDRRVLEQEYSQNR